MPTLILQRLALPADATAGTPDPARRPLYWRGDAVASEGVLRGRGTVGLGTWLNAAPTGWWARLGVRGVRLSVRGTGAITVHVASGGVHRVVARGVATTAAPYVLDLAASDADWHWVEAAARPDADGSDADGPGTDEHVVDGPVIEGVEWETQVGSAVVRPITAVVPTYRMEDAALAQLARLTAPSLDGVVGRVVLIDQGGTLAAHPGATEALAAAGDKVLFVEQPNLGGSGGYSRGLLEASERWPEDPVFLHDDDAEADQEGLRRLQTLAALHPRTFFPTALLAAEAPTSLEALAEGVARGPFRWGPTDGVGDGVDVGATTPDGWAFTRPGDPAEYGGWWGCLVPAGAVESLGLAAPYFLKWDDAEYGLRARRAGFAVASVPGPSVWHPTWAAKGTIASWSSWPLHRNRLATAAAYGAGRGVLLDSFVHQVKHVLSLQYATAELWNAALAELLDGPGWLTRDLTEVRPRAQALLDAMPRPGLPTSARGTVTLASPRDFGWRTGLGRRAVVFRDGSAPLVGDPRRGGRAFARTLRLHARAARTWRRLSREYRDALGPAASAAAWRARLDGAPE